MIDAFRAERRSSLNQGFVYGLMWEALDEPDHLPKFEAGITYSAEEHQEAFVAGIAEGRAKAKDGKVRNQIILAVATLGESSGYGEFYAANEVLSQLWRAKREPSPGDSGHRHDPVARAVRPEPARPALVGDAQRVSRPDDEAARRRTVAAPSAPRAA